MTNKMSAVCLGKGGKKFLKIHQSSASRNEFSWPVRLAQNVTRGHNQGTADSKII